MEKRKGMTLTEILGDPAKIADAELPDFHFQADEATSWTPEQYKAFARELESINYRCDWVLVEKKPKNRLKRLWRYLKSRIDNST